MPAFGSAASVTPVDFVLSLGANVLGTDMATKNPTLRAPLWNAAKDSPWSDARFVGGLAGAALWQMGIGGKWGRKIGFIAANGGLNSFVTTERVRRASIAKASGSGGGGAATPPAQLQAPVGIPQGIQGFAGAFATAPGAYR